MKLSTIKQFSGDNPALTEGSLRYQIFLEHTNGLAASGAIIRIGRRVFINPDRYFAWVMAQNGGQAA